MNNLFSKATLGEWMRLGMVLAALVWFSGKQNARLDLIEYRLASLEQVESRDIAELKEDISVLANSLSVCQSALVRLESGMDFLRKEVERYNR